MAEKSFTHVYNLQYYKPKLWERIVLPFLPMETYANENAEMTYKSIGSRLYMYGFKIFQDPMAGTFTNFKDN